MTMGEKILSMRKARGWSQEELAERIGVTRQAVSRWESGAAKPDADKIIAVCDLFGVSADYLLRDTGGGMSELKPENELQKAIRTMPLRRWIGGILILLCGVVLLVIWAMSIIYPVAVYPEQQLRDFLYFYRLRYVWYAVWAGLAVGLWKAFSPKQLKEYPWKAWWDRFASAFRDLMFR